MAYDYETLKKIANNSGRQTSDLIALDRVNDPFYVGSKNDIAMGQWFADLVAEFCEVNGVRGNIHVRRIHYYIVKSAHPVIKPNGTAYVNDINNWTYLDRAFKSARFLKLVDPELFVDHRSNEPIICTDWIDSDDEPSVSIWSDYKNEIVLPTLPKLDDLREKLPELPSIFATGYEVQQDYHIEIWCEKTTVNDVLLPLCKRYQVNLITGSGEIGSSIVYDFLKRAERADRPARILYISDFDPVGHTMPISIARKIEWYQRNDRFGDLDIALHPIALTLQQIKEYNLPRKPIENKKKSKHYETRIGNFQAANGDGAVELDALEYHDLHTIVEREILRYVDPHLTNKTNDVEQELQDALNEERQDILDDHHTEIEAVSNEYRAIREEFKQTQKDYNELVAGFQSKLDAYKERISQVANKNKKLCGLIHGELEGVEVDFNDYPIPEPDIEGDPDDLLYSSNRSYFEQLAVYKQYKNGSEAQEL